MGSHQGGHVDELLMRWLPNGIERNGRWYVGDFDGSPGESANVNMATGQWIDNAAPDEEKGGDLISLYARIKGLNNSQAARELMRDLGWERQQPAVQAPARAAPAPAAGDTRPEPQDDAQPTPPAKRRSVWQPIVPVPALALERLPDFRFGYRDKKAGDRWVEQKAVTTWQYAFEGQVFGYVARYERVSSDGEVVKDTIPWTWCKDDGDSRGLCQWRAKVWDEPRPLFVPATLLSSTPADVPVVVVEGEKCALAGHQLLGHEFDFVSWQGGCKTWMLANWGWLIGRTVYLWSDCDAKRERLTKAEREAGADPATKDLLPESKQPGMRAMIGIGELLQTQFKCTVLMCRIPQPGAVGDGWDIADAIEQGWDAPRVRAFIRAAHAFTSPNDSVRAAVGDATVKISARSRASATDGEGGEEDASRRWLKYLISSEKGAIKPVRENVVLALDGWPSEGVPGIPEAAGLIAFNEFTNNVEKTRETPWGTPPGPWEESDELLMGEWLLRDYYLPSMSRGTLEEAVLMVARRHAFHPVRERVEACRGKWDKVDRLDTWLARACLEEDEWDARDPLHQYLALAGKWFVMAMCCRVLPQVKDGARIVRGPGTKFDYMLIFEGPQGWGKSTLAQVMGGEHFADTGLILGEKDSYQNIQGVLIYEWGELENMSKQEVSKVKLFISSPKDRFRASFDRRPRDYPRQVVFVGTTNESHYLTDPTGNRRFWPVRVTRPPDSAWLAANLEQLFAEALARLDAGERFWPTREEQALLFDPQQQSRTVESSIEASIRHYLYQDDQKVPHGGVNGSLLNEITMSDLLTRIGYTIDKQTDVVVKKAGAVMHMLGWTVRRTSLPGRPRAYMRPPVSSQEAAVVPQASGSHGSTRPAQDESTAGADDDCPF